MPSILRDNYVIHFLFGHSRFERVATLKHIEVIHDKKYACMCSCGSHGKPKNWAIIFLQNHFLSVLTAKIDMDLMNISLVKYLISLVKRI